jgi:hypothetical protein
VAGLWWSGSTFHATRSVFSRRARFPLNTEQADKSAVWPDSGESPFGSRSGALRATAPPARSAVGRPIPISRRRRVRRASRCRAAGSAPLPRRQRDRGALCDAELGHPPRGRQDAALERPYGLVMSPRGGDVVPSRCRRARRTSRSAGRARPPAHARAQPARSADSHQARATACRRATMVAGVPITARGRRPQQSGQRARRPRRRPPIPRE